MASKQKKLITILEKLAPYRPSAEGLIALLSTMEVEDKILENIIKLINSSIKELKTAKNKAKMQQVTKLLEKMEKDTEKEHSEADKILLDL